MPLDPTQRSRGVYGQARVSPLRWGVSHVGTHTQVGVYQR